MVIILAIYGKNNLKKHNKNIKKKIGIVLVSVFSVFLINLLFNIIPFLNSFFLGCFGLLTYAIFTSSIVFGVMMIIDKSISVNTKTLLLYICEMILLISLIHLITSNQYIDMTFSSYLSSCYSAKYTAGGIIFGLLAYPVCYLTHFIGAIIIFLVLRMIMIL